ncbi:hypothetical protein N7539_002350 [Penicillium diatomitis]|uniref:Uncharacterized protein n=1 Tax=Penicillium diatomitis TaxID=2819901 RepID=A0A9X0BZ07_9EURO|nr:uncharacterized protein N7539_002350 [Penicillium diatomitis]KAJ5490783.1 hypothetical protein N7539_002350 [Penicillium diatomitis]
MQHSKQLRVLVIVSQRSSLYNLSTTAPEEIVLRAMRLVKWRSRTYLVFDIAHDEYDTKLGHLPEHNQLHVLVAHFSKKKAAYPASSWVSQQVNHDVAMLHNANGYDVSPPFVEDHTLGAPPTYRNPRDISLLRVEYV